MKLEDLKTASEVHGEERSPAYWFYYTVGYLPNKVEIWRLRRANKRRYNGRHVKQPLAIEGPKKETGNAKTGKSS